jgi:hypothetical protein
LARDSRRPAHSQLSDRCSYGARNVVARSRLLH